MVGVCALAVLWVERYISGSLCEWGVRVGGCGVGDSTGHKVLYGRGIRLSDVWGGGGEERRERLRGRWRG